MKRGIIALSLAGLFIAAPITFVNAKQTTTLEQKIEKSFPSQQIQHIENFMQYSDDIMRIVAEKMNYTIDDKIPLPTIIRSDEITLEGYSKLWGYKVKAMCSVYFPEENILVISVDKKLDSFAHEFVHYFQIQYGHEDPMNDPWMMLEREAMYIQDWFKDKYLK